MNIGLHQKLIAEVGRIAGRYHDSFLNDLTAIVGIDSGTYDKSGVDQVGDWFAARFAEWGWGSERYQSDPYGDCRSARLTGSGSARALLLGHMDTVYEIGTAAARGIRVDGDVLLGPGTADMKAGLLTALYALRALQEVGFEDFAEIILFCNSDEEVGSTVSRQHYLPLARQSDFALVFECARENGDIVSARKGGGSYHIEVHGKSAHAGVAPETGANAIVQLARLVDAATNLNGLQTGVTVNAGVIQGGTRPNVVPDHATLDLDVRAVDTVGAEAVHVALMSLVESITVHGTSVEIFGQFQGMPMERTPGNARLVEIASGVGESLGFAVRDAPMTGGRSDANYVAAHAGLPTVDGLGPIGGADHCPSEYILVSSIVPRIALAAGVIASACGDVSELRRLRRPYIPFEGEEIP